MGLLDALFPQQDGGFLDFLKRNADAAVANSPGGLPSDMAQYGNQQPMAPPVGYQPGQVQSAPLQQPQPMAQPQPQMPGSLAPPSQAPQPMAAPQAPAMAPTTAPSQGGFMPFYQNLHGGGGLIGSVIAGVTGQRNDPQGLALQQQAQVANQTARALIGKGIPQDVAIAAVQPGNTEMLKTLVDQAFGAPKSVVSLGDGHVWNPNTNKYETAYEKSDKNKVVQIGEDGLGQKQFGILNESDGSIKPIAPPNGGAAGSGGGLGDMSKTGAEYLATVPPAQRGVLQGMVDGTIQPPSSFAASKPYWQNMLAAAKQVDPNFDANTWASRHKMSTDIASSGNSSVGGILANGKSSFSHLADLSKSMADLGNASHNYPGGGAAAAVENYLGNKTFAGSDTRAKIKAINDNLGHYGQESTKFYSGTGGGAEERMNALKEMNPETTSSAEMASYVEKEKSLMLERLREKERNIRDVMGEAYLAKHPVMTPEFQAKINEIDANVAKLRGQKPASSSAAPGVSEGATATNPQTGQRVVFKGGSWVPLQ
jgi:hypothetical protein